MGSMSQKSSSLQETSQRKQLECPKCGLYSPLADELLSLRAQVITDPLTGLFNLRHFRTALDIEMERTIRTSVPTTLMMIDLDHFKHVNDQWGHEAGNQVLKITARLICKATRQLDIQCRYGGEEFVVILPSTSLLLASQVAERLREMIEQAEVVVDESVLRVTASIGLSVYLPNEVADASCLIKKADECLYQAKTEGRNRVCYKSLEESVEAAVSMDEKEALLGMFSDYTDE